MTLPPPMPLEEAQARLLEMVEPVSIVSMPVEAALGHYLASSVKAHRTQPASSLSAMDGYALVSGDLDGPWQIVGESAAGHPYTGNLSAGQTVRISTGAVLPADAAVVLLQEDVCRDGNHLTLTGEPPQPENKHIRPEGMDFHKGQTILEPGTRIGPAHVALLLSAGHAAINVYRPVSLMVMDSGDELCGDPSACAPHQIPASNGAMLAALTSPLPVQSRKIGPVADAIDALVAALETAVDTDVIVTSGGASVGDHDLIRPALEAWGAQIAFWRVAIKPGKPLLIASRDIKGRRQIIIGLPGNPVSSMVTAYLFLLPVLRKMAGSRQPLPRTLSTMLSAPTRATGTRREFLRGVWDGQSVLPLSLQDSSALSSLAASNVLIDRPAHSQTGEAGDPVQVFLLDNGGIA